MKNTCIAILSIIFLTTSCYQDEQQENCINDVKNQLSINKELETLRIFNDSIIQQPRTRGWFGTLTSVFSADMLGACAGFKASIGVAAYITAATGGTAGPATGIAVLASTGLIAGGASYGAYKGCSTVITEEEYNKHINSLLKQPIRIGKHINTFKSKCKLLDVSTIILEEHTCDLIAELHDSIVNIALDIEEQPITKSTPDLSTPIDPILPTYNDNSYNIPIFSDRDIKNLNHTVNNNLIDYYQNHNYEKTLNCMIEQQNISVETGNILRLLMDVLYQGEISDEATLEIVLNRYSNVIKESTNISIEDKNCLLIGLSVAKNSFRLWKNKME
ncbi:hypothetical protein [uncultured Bacteroides sp.]|uniref:hypothetical protein n=1 Tax=uncultured Bacteroides sp. TaxID=162156 RepID=UPI0025FBF9BF|nr:hypothetical protein [uncultured Bacteroides sp.]